MSSVVVQIANKVISKYRDVGLLYTMGTIAARLLPAWVFSFRIFDIVGQNLDGNPAPAAAAPEIFEARLEDAPAITANSGSKEIWQERFAKGYRVWIVVEKDRVVACDWLAGADDKEIRPWLHLRGNAGDVFNLFYWVAMSHRGLGLGTKIMSRAVSEARAAGYTRMLGDIDIDNHASRRAVQKSGFSPLARCSYVRLWQLTCLFYRGRWRIGIWSAKTPLVLEVPPYRAQEDYGKF